MQQHHQPIVVYICNSVNISMSIFVYVLIKLFCMISD